MTTIETLSTPVYFANYDAYKSGKYRLIANQGSTRSSKTYSIDQVLIDVALEVPNKEISIVSQTLPHLKKGARKDAIEILKNMGIYSDKDFNKTDQVYTFSNGSYIEFFSADDETKVKGPGRDILFINEANHLKYDVYKQLALRTKEVIFVDYNPAGIKSYVYDLLLLPDTKFIKSTYKQNLRFLTKAQIAEIESMNPEINPITGDWQLWRVYGLGERAAGEAQIYTHWNLVDRLPDNPDETIYGLDFGYNNPSALVQIDFKDTVPYRKQLFYQTKLTNSDIIEKLKIFVPNKRKPIYADAAEPDRIQEIKRAGFNIHPANKDVTKGIDHVKSQPMPITKDSTEMIDEVQFYSWKTDRDGNLLDEPVKLKDHAMDADRYALYTHSIKPTYSMTLKMT